MIYKLSKECDRKNLVEENVLIERVIIGDINNNVDAEIDRIITNFQNVITIEDNDYGYNRECFDWDLNLLSTLDIKENADRMEWEGSYITAKLKFAGGMEYSVLQNVMYTLCAPISWSDTEWRFAQDMYLHIFMAALQKDTDLMMMIAALIKAGEVTGNFKRFNKYEPPRIDKHEQFLRDRILEVIVEQPTL